jgi:hypothetical protein
VVQPEPARQEPARQEPVRQQPARQDNPLSLEPVRQEAPRPEPVREPARPELRRQEPLIRTETPSVQTRQPEAPRPTRLPEARNTPLQPKAPEAEIVTSIARPTLDQRASVLKPALQPEAPTAQAPADRQAASDRQASSDRSDENGGWLRDVLRNASAKQAGAQQNNLTGLTEEIAKSMDQGALADAWMRYQGGESNVFSRRIYTLTGQGTYDEIRKKLQRDADFARTAQAYMAEFEQLLKRAAAGPRAAAETREYLLSDRGKVYTMLAHASGRLN